MRQHRALIAMLLAALLITVGASHYAQPQQAIAAPVPTQAKAAAPVLTAADQLIPKVETSCNTALDKPRFRVGAENVGKFDADVSFSHSGPTISFAPKLKPGQEAWSEYIYGDGYGNVTYTGVISGTTGKFGLLKYTLSTGCAGSGPTTYTGVRIQTQCDVHGNGHVTATVLNNAAYDINAYIYQKDASEPVFNKVIKPYGYDFWVGDNLAQSGGLEYFEGTRDKQQHMGEMGWEFQPCTDQYAEAQLDFLPLALLQRATLECPQSLADIVAFGFSDAPDIQPTKWFRPGERYDTQQPNRFLWLQLTPREGYYIVKWVFDPGGPVDPINATELYAGTGRPNDPPLTFALGFKQGNGSITPWKTQPGWVTARFAHRNQAGDCVAQEILIIKVDDDGPPATAVTLAARLDALRNEDIVP